MQRIVDNMRLIARHELGQRSVAALAVVQTVHGRHGAVEHACTVELREPAIVLPHVPIAVGVIGFAALPRQGDLVVVLFLGGDLHAPVIVGRLYNEDVKPPLHGPGEVVVSLPGDEEADDKRLEVRVKTPGDGTRSLKVVLDGQSRVEVEIKDQEIRLVAQDASLTLRQTGSSDGHAELKVGQSSVVIEQGGDVTITAGGTLKLQGKSVEISGDTKVKVAGQVIDLN